ncbi:MAG: recombinase family protein [Clostridia bacterium]|nr:recombinase family protein [Clostridia bacterium]
MQRKKKTACPPKTAVAYARYSSAGQRDVSIDQQLKDIRAYAEREGYTIIHEYADRAKSGFKNASARVQFQEMLSSASSGLFDTVIAWKVDRFGRNRRDSALYKGQLRDQGVNVVYAMEPIPTGAAGVLTEGMLESIAEWYSRNLSENVIRGMRDNALKGLYNGAHILGYRPGPDRKYEIDPAESAIVRQIYKKYIAGHSAGSIASELNALGLTNTRGLPFSVDSVMRVINSKSYIGVYRWGELEIPGGMPRIVTDKEWEDAQRMKKKTTRHFKNSPADFLLTGKAFCGLCGRPMVGDSGKSHTGAMHYYYTCTGRNGRNGLSPKCDKKSVRRDWLEKNVLDFIYDRCLTGPEREKITDAIVSAQLESEKSSPRSAMASELKDTEKKISNINDAIENGIWNSSTSIRLKALEDAAEQLRASIAEIDLSRAQLLDRDRILFFLEKMSQYNRDDPDRRRQLISTFINAVFVFDDHLLIVINAVEGNVTVSLSDLVDSDGFEGEKVRDSSCLAHQTRLIRTFADGLPHVPRSNKRVVVYTIAV